MCHVLFYEPRDDEPQYICYLVDRDSAETLADKLSQQKKITVHVQRFPLADARRLGIKYWETVVDDFTPLPS